MSISITTVVMNRTEHLLRQARVVSMLRGHDEHIILDFGSTVPVKRDELPNDQRIKLHRLDSPNERWWLTHSYNLVFALASGDYILKLDGDILPSQQFMDLLLKQQAESKAHLMCNRLTLQDWSLPSGMFTTNGLFLCKRTSLAKVGGFNPYIQGWGWDEIDLYSRFFLAGFPVSRIPRHGLDIIQHGDDEREQPIRSAELQHLGLSRAIFDQVSTSRRMRAHNEKNRQIALASIKNYLSWPSFADYVKSYRDLAQLPKLSSVSLFNSEEKLSLVTNLRTILLKPSRRDNIVWRIAKRLGFGPYTPANTVALLKACNIDLTLVT